MSDNGEVRRAWHATAVSWGQFLVAICAVVVVVLMALVSDRIAIDQRVTVVEQHQRYADAIEAREAMEYSSLRGAVDSKLTDIQRQLVVITIELAKHESAQNGDENRRGLRLPK